MEHIDSLLQMTPTSANRAGARDILGLLEPFQHTEWNDFGHMYNADLETLWEVYDSEAFGVEE